MSKFLPRQSARDLEVSRETILRLDGIITDLFDVESEALSRFLVPSEIDDSTYVLDAEALRAEADDIRDNKEAIAA